MMEECLKVTGSGLITDIRRNLHQWFCAEPLSETAFCVFYGIGQTCCWAAADGSMHLLYYVFSLYEASRSR